MERSKNKKNFLFPIISTVVFAITIILNYGTMFGWFDMNQEQISDQYKNLVTPAGFTFSIWGVIYALVIGFLGHQFYLVAKNRYKTNYYNKMHILFIITCVFNIVWNITWVYDKLIVATVFIFLFEITLCLINLHIDNKYPKEDNMITPIAFSIYFGWLTVATVTNVAALLIKYDWNMFGLEQYIIACVAYVLIAVIAGLLILWIRNSLFNLPIIWALAGISSTVASAVSNSGHRTILMVVIALVIIFLLLESVFVFFRNGKKLFRRTNSYVA